MGPIGTGAVGKTAAMERCVSAPGSEQRAMGTLLDHPPLVHHQDLVRVHATGSRPKFLRILAAVLLTASARSRSTFKC